MRKAPFVLLTFGIIFGNIAATFFELFLVLRVRQRFDRR